MRFGGAGIVPRITPGQARAMISAIETAVQDGDVPTLKEAVKRCKVIPRQQRPECDERISAAWERFKREVERAE